MNWLRRFGFVSVISVLVALLSVTGVLAASISEVVDSVDDFGYYVEPGLSISESEAAEIVAEARGAGSNFYLVVVDGTPLGGAPAFAESVYDDLFVDSGTVLVLADEIGTFSEDEYSLDQLDAAEDAALQAGSDADAARLFINNLFGISVEQEPAAATPTTAASTSGSSSSSSDGGGSGLLIFFLIIVGIGLLLWWVARRGKKQTVNEAAARMAEARGVVQKQVDAIANDILDMEDEVRVANNDKVDEFYNAAAETYRTVTERLQKADTPHELVDLSNDLDLAIWQLDSAEAILDGKAQPPKPEPKRLEPERDPEGKVTIPAPRPDYQRRPTRRSSLGGGGLMEILIGVAGQVLAGGGGRRGGLGGLGGMLGGGRRGRTPRQPTSRARGQSSGGVIPGPGSPVQRTTRRTSSPSRRPRSKGRVRTKGKRRRRR